MSIDVSSTADLRVRVASNLARFEACRAGPVAGLRHAAVTICVVERRGTPHVVVIKRAARGRHAGQWALPGGRLDHGETPRTAALRELGEEVRIGARTTDVVGVLDDFVSGSGFVITPFVAFPTDTRPPRRNPDEVHSVHFVPVQRLLDPDLPRWRPQPDGPSLLQMPLRSGMVVHAPTGAILWQFREVGLLGRASRVRDLAEPALVREA